MAASLRDASPSFAQPEPRRHISPNAMPVSEIPAYVTQPRLHSAPTSSSSSTTAAARAATTSSTKSTRSPTPPTARRHVARGPGQRRPGPPGRCRLVGTHRNNRLPGRPESPPRRSPHRTRPVARDRHGRHFDYTPGRPPPQLSDRCSRGRPDEVTAIPIGNLAARPRCDGEPTAGRDRLGRRRSVAGRGPPSPGPLVIRLDRQSPMCTSPSPCLAMIAVGLDPGRSSSFRNRRPRHAGPASTGGRSDRSAEYHP